MMRKIFKTILLLFLPVALHGQLSSLSNQYVFNPLSINPAYAGNREALNIAAFYRRQWTGIPGAPETMTFAADAPFLDSKLGLGFIVTNDKVGVTKETHFMTNYSYKIALEKGSLSFGLGAGIKTTNTAWSNLVVLDPGDEEFLRSTQVFVLPQFSFGIYFSGQDYYAGLSMPNLLESKFDVNKDKYSLSFNPDQYLLNFGYSYTVNSKMKFLPSALLTMTPGQKILLDLNAFLSLNERFWGGLSFRTQRSVGALLQVAVNNQIRVAYSYDFDLGKLGRFSFGSHEIMLRYIFRYKVDAVSPLNF